MPNVYDDENTGGASGGKGRQPDGHKGEAADSQKSSDASAISDDERNAGKKAEQDKASKTESDQLGRGFNDKDGDSENPKSLRKKARRMLWSTHKRKVISGVAAGGLGAGLIFGGMTMLAPLKLVHITQNLQDQYFGVSEQAVDSTLDNLVKHYLIRWVMPNMLDGVCSTTRVERTCAAPITGSGPVSQLYRAWRDARFETKLANNHGIELLKRGTGKDAIFYIRAPGIDRDGVRLGTYDNVLSYDGNLFAEIPVEDRNKVRTAYKDALKKETKWYQVMYRFKVGRFIEQKYGIVRCAFACEIRDKGKDAWRKNVTERFDAGKGLLTRKVLKPAQEATSLAIECAISGFDCTTYDDADNEGKRKTKYERDLLARVAALRADGGSIEDLERDTENIRRKGVSRHFTEKVAGKLTDKLISKTIPIVGWIDLAVLLKEGAQNAGPAMRYLSYVYVAQAMADTFSTYRIAADELKDGHNVDIATMGELSDEISGEGGYTAEQAPLYQDLFGDKGPSVANLVNPKANATATSKVLEDVCPDEPSPGDTICPNESLEGGSGSAIAKSANIISAGIDAYDDANPSAALASDAWFAASNQIFDWLGTAVGWVLEKLSADRALSWISDTFGLTAALKSFGSFFVTHMLPAPFAPIANSINNFDLMAGGADVMGNEFCRDELGCAAVSDSEAAAIRTDYLSQQDEQFQNQSFFVRMFDTDSPRSAVSRLALAMPNMSGGSLHTAFANFTENPFGGIASIFSGLFTASSTSADHVDDPFGVQQYAFPSSHPVFSQDPEKVYNDANCDDPDQKKNWTDEHSHIDPATGQYVVTEPNPCKLLDTAIESGGALFSDEFIPDESPIVSGGDSSGGGSSSDGWVWPMDPPISSGPCFGQQVRSLGIHAGVDINTSSDNNPVKAAHDGVVYKVGYDEFGGNYIIIKTTGPGDTRYYSYQHLKDNSITVRAGEDPDIVKAGEVVGIADTTGRFYGSSSGHLHMVVANSPTLGSYGSLTGLEDPLKLLPPPPGGYSCG